jgi:O-succinylbenzoate synthase
MVNGLLQEEEPLEQAVNDLLMKGFQSIKVKAGGVVKKDVERVKAVMELVNNRARIHLDVNQRWSYEDSLYFASEIIPKQIEYIEEPFKDITRIPDFFQKTNIAVALDESILLSDWKMAQSLRGVKVWVLKPTLLGGIRKALAAAHDAQNNGVSLVISSSFETGIGLSSLIHLAAACGNPVRAGIDTLKYFDRDLLKKPLVIKDGKLNVPTKTMSSEDIYFEYLTEV